MRTDCNWFVFGWCVVTAALVLGQSRGDQKGAGRESPGRQELTPVNEFPSPLEYARSNLSDLEQDELLSIVGVEDRAANELGERGFVWTVKTNRPVTYRHVQMILQRFRDVRFYVTQTTTSREVHSALLYYSGRIDVGAANGQVFLEDDEFEIWFYLGRSNRDRLNKQQIDRIVFRRLRR